MKLNKFLPSVLNSATALVSTSILTAGVLTLTASAKAATFACSAEVASKVSGTTACEVSDTANQDFLNTNPLTVNGENFFGIDDWVFGGKIGVNAGYLGDGEGQSGEWDISNVFQNTWDDVMLIFKDGNNTFITGYLLQDGVTTGTWSSPFLEPGKDPKDVSHISVYYTTGGTTTSVPEPGTMLALAITGIGIVTYRCRKSPANS